MLLLIRLVQSAWQGLFRRSLRTVFVLTAVTIGTIGLLLFFGVASSLQQDVAAQLSTYAPATVLHVDAPLQLGSSPTSAPPTGISPKTLTILQHLPHVLEAFPEQQVGGTVTIASMPVPLELRPVPPTYLTQAAGVRLIKGSFFRTEDGNDIVITAGFIQTIHDVAAPSGVAEQRKISSSALPTVSSIVGQVLKFTPQESVNVTGPPVRLRVIGVIDSHVPFAFLPYKSGERILAQGSPSATAVDSIIVEVDNVRAVASVRQAIVSLHLHVETPQNYADSIVTVLNIAKLVAAIVGIGGLFLALLNIITMLLASVSERASEIGIMKALGAQDWHIGVIFLSESIMLGLIGSGIGAIAAAIIAQLLSSTLPLQSADLPPLRITTPPLMLVSGIIVVLFLSGLSGIIPALRAARLEPAQAITSHR